MRRALGVGLALCIVLIPLQACGGSPATSSVACMKGLTRSECAVFGPDLLARRGGSFGLDRLALIKETGTPGGAGLRVTYPAGSASQNSHRVYGSPSGGAQVYLPLRAGSVSALWLSYFVRFQPGFDFVKGGKLPGMYGGSQTSGGRIPNGTDGLSTRLMWRAGGEGEIYAYLPSSIKHGTSIGRGSWTFTPGHWEKIVQYVRLNTPGRSDGEIRLFVNGESVVDVQDLVFRTTRSLLIDGVFFSTFFGGSDQTWATPVTQHADFAGFRVSETGA